MRMLYVLVIASAARAEPTLGELVKQSGEAQARGDFAQAASLLEQARARAPGDPVPAFKLGRVERAWADAPSADRRAHLAAAIARFDDVLASSAADAELRRTAASERDEARAALLAMPAESPAPATSVTTTAQPAPARACDGWRCYRWTIVASSAAVALGGAAAGAGLWTKSAYADLSSRCAGSLRGCSSDGRSAVESKALVTNVLIGAAAAAAVTAGCVWWFVEHPRARVAVVPTGTGAAAFASF